MQMLDWATMLRTPDNQITPGITPLYSLVRKLVIKWFSTWFQNHEHPKKFKSFPDFDVTFSIHYLFKQVFLSSILDRSDQISTSPQDIKTNNKKSTRHHLFCPWLPLFATPGGRGHFRMVMKPNPSIIKKTFPGSMSWRPLTLSMKVQLEEIEIWPLTPSLDLVWIAVIRSAGGQIIRLLQ